MPIEELDILLKAGSLALSAINSLCLAILWFGSRGRVTREAIDRVETAAREMHAEQENRIVNIEAELRHVLSKKDLEHALMPLYDLVRSAERSVAGLTSDVKNIAESQRVLNGLIMQRGIEK